MRSKLFFILSILLALSLLCACGADTNSSNSETTNPGAKTYKQFCSPCHGIDGKLGLGEAADLSKSTLTVQESIKIITEGGKMMTPYKSILSPKEIEDVANYILELRQ